MKARNNEMSTAGGGSLWKGIPPQKHGFACRLVFDLYIETGPDKVAADVKNIGVAGFSAEVGGVILTPFFPKENDEARLYDYDYEVEAGIFDPNRPDDYNKNKNQHYETALKGEVLKWTND